MSSPEQWTIGRLLTWTTDYLQQHGSDSPRLEAEVLLAESRGCQRIQLYTAFDELADETTRTAFRELVRRRAEGTPVAYLVGHREFYSLSFRVSPAVLIPRPETELLVVRLLDLVKQREVPPGEVQIADVGTGSGVIAVCAAKQLKQAHVCAIDMSGAALEIARANAVKHGVAERIEFIEGDLLAALPAEPRFHIIASNPPYVTEAEFATLAPGVKNYEPRGALVAGPRGTEVIERLLPQAQERLLPGGWLLLEVSPMIEPAVCQFIDAQSCWRRAATIKDLANHARVVQAQHT